MNVKNTNDTANDFDDYIVNAEALEIEHDIDSGEYNILVSEFGAALLSDDDEDDTNDNSSSSVSKGSASATATAAGTRKAHDRKAVYGPPLLKADAAQQVLQTEYAKTDGLIRYALVIPDQFYVQGALVPGLNPRDFTMDATTQTATIKTQRPSLVLTMTDLRSSLTLVDDGGPHTGTTTAPPRYLFQGCLNGWPSMGHGFELMELEKKRPGLSVTATTAGGRSISSSSSNTNNNRRRPTARAFAQVAQQSLLQAHHTMGAAVGRSSWIANWSPQKHGHFLGFSDPTQLYRAKLRGPDWTSGGCKYTSFHNFNHSQPFISRSMSFFVSYRIWPQIYLIFIVVVVVVIYIFRVCDQSRFCVLVRKIPSRPGSTSSVRHRPPIADPRRCVYPRPYDQSSVCGRET